MTNLRKCLSVSAFAFIALAFCCLVIGQAVTAKINTKTVTGSSIDRAIPLPSEDTRSAGSGSALSSTRQISEVGGYFDEDGILHRDADWKNTPIRGISKEVSSPKQGGDLISSATPIAGPLPVTVTGTTSGYESDYNSTLCGSYDGAPDVVYSYVADGSGAPFQYVDIDLCESGYDTKVWVLESDGTTEIACNDDACPGYRSYLAGVQLVDGETYYIIIGGYDNTCFGPYEMTLTAGPDPYTCMPGDIDEGEPCGTDTNGPTTPLTLNCGETRCGTIWADGETRDTDWYEFFIDEVTYPDGLDVTYDVLSDFGDAWWLLLYDETQTMVGILHFDGPYTETNSHVYLPPGTWYFRVGPNVFDGYACGTNTGDPVDGNYRYKFSIDCAEVTPGDDCFAATPISDGVTPFDLTGMTGDEAGFGYGGPAAWWEYEATADGILTVSVCFDQALAEWDDLYGVALWSSCYPAAEAYDNLLDFAYNYDGAIFYAYDCATDGPWVVSSPALTGDFVLIEVLSYWGTFDYTGTITVEFTPLTAYNDICLMASGPDDPAYRLPDGEVHDMFIHNFGAGTDGAYSPNYGSTIANTRCDDQGVNENGLGGDVWYFWRPDQTGWWSFNTCEGVGWDGKLEVFEGLECPNAHPRYPIACSDDDCIREGAGVMPNAEFWAIEGQDYLFRLGGWVDNDDPDHPSQGTAILNLLYEETPVPRPPNDNCADAPNNALVPGVVDVRFGTLDAASNHDCLMSPPTVWEAITLPDYCANVAMDYCPQGDITTTPDVNDDNYWVADEIMYTACPCYDGIQVNRDSRAWNLCPAAFYLKTMYFNDLTPGSYYFPITPGFRACPSTEFEGCDYGVSFVATELLCSYCTGEGSALSCPASGSTWIEGVQFSNLNRQGSGMSECTGYSDYTETVAPADVYEGLVYGITVTGQKNGGILDDNDDIWVYFDWEQDYSFFQLGNYFHLTRVGRNWIGDITIPFGIPGPGEGPSGTTIMRVRMSKVTEGPNAACGSTTWGEVEDYLVNVNEILCGDLNDDEAVDVADIDVIRALYFDPASADPAFWQAADATGDCVFNIADVIYLADYVYGRQTTMNCWPCTPL